MNTISEAALVSLPIYSLYSAAKAAVAQFTLVASREAGEYGVRVNAYAPRALTRMTPGAADIDRSVPHPLDESNSSTLVAWLLSGESSGVTGRLFQTVGGAIALRPMWSPGEILWPPPGRSRFEAAELSDVLAPIIGSGALPDAILVPPGRPKPAWIALSCRSNLTRTTSSY